ncbi:hypothetical protein E2C01_059723 [Portunus trituberculatus]|uniref:Uncharacterized protein n=1 Tax=Portunus trituberculatus TaxID=210409 RepID=A0A5B7H7E8_PORTR|nr:hypothetical protein [Portunus trituberculatus]
MMGFQSTLFNAVPRPILPPALPILLSSPSHFVHLAARRHLAKGIMVPSCRGGVQLSYRNSYFGVVCSCGSDDAGVPRRNPTPARAPVHPKRPLKVILMVLPLPSRRRRRCSRHRPC